LKLGFFGVGYDYRQSTATKNVDYEDRLDAAYRLANHLRRVDQVDLVICLAHVPFADGPLIVTRAPEIDLVLMGHNHFWSYRKQNDVNIVEGDINLEKFSVIDISFIRGGKTILREEKVTYIVPDNTTPKDRDMEVIVEKYASRLEKEFGQVIGRTDVTLDGSNNDVRSRETNIGDFVADAMRNWSMAVFPDSPFPYIALMNGGALRWNRVFPPGNLTKGDLVELLPFGNVIIVFLMKYADLRAVLEDGLAFLPDPDGSFFQISGFRLFHNCRLTNESNANAKRSNDAQNLNRQFYDSVRNQHEPPPLAHRSLVPCDAPVGSRIRNLTYYNGTQIAADQQFVVAVPGYYLGDPRFSHLTLLVDEEAGVGDVELMLGVIQAQSPIRPVTSGRIVPLP
jgi:2',3'-cyclic-nucleotide 2'-phosphodiesterase (5'-nucleotidase family)